MSTIIITAAVKDAAKWEAGFQTHIDYFKGLSISQPIRYSTNEDNEVAIYIRPDNLKTYLEGLDTQETAEAMAYDGVKRETVKIYVLDKELQL